MLDPEVDPGLHTVIAPGACGAVGAQTLPTPLPDPSRLWAFLWWPFSQYTVPAWLALTDP